MKNNTEGTDVPKPTSTPLGYYKWFPRDFLASSVVRRMSMTAQGIYRALLDLQWEDGSVPEDYADACLILKLTDAEADAFKPFYGQCFPNGINPKLDEQRKLSIDYIEKQRSRITKSGSKQHQVTPSYKLADSKPTASVNPTTTTTTTETNKIKKETTKSKSYAIADALADARTAGIFNQVLLDAIGEFVAHRKEIKHPLTARGAKAIINKLMAVSPDVAVEAINKSIASGWRDVFPDAVAKQKKRDGQTAPKIKAGAMQWFNEYQQEQARIAKARADAEAKANQKALPASTVDMTDEEKLELVIADE